MDHFKIPCTRNQCCCNKLIIWVLQFSTVFWDFFAVAPKSVLILKKTNIIGCFLNTVNIPTVLKFMVSVPVPRSHNMIEQIPFSCRSMILLYCLVYCIYLVETCFQSEWHRISSFHWVFEAYIARYVIDVDWLIAFVFLCGLVWFYKESYLMLNSSTWWQSLSIFKFNL